jgi:hypothetical protein
MDTNRNGHYYTPPALAYLTARTDTYVNAYGVTDVDPTRYGNVYTLANPPFVGNPYPYVIRSADRNADATGGG